MLRLLGIILVVVLFIIVTFGDNADPTREIDDAYWAYWARRVQAEEAQKCGEE